MPFHRSVEVANAFLKKPGAIGHRTQMQLQKLTYIAHGWNLAINGDALTSDFARAWDYGPVYPDLYHHAKFFGSRPLTRQITPDDDNGVAFFIDEPARAEPYPVALTIDEQAVVDHVWTRYGNYSAFRLSELTHKPGTPWYETYFGKGKGAVIDNDIIRDHYLLLAQQLEPAAA